MPDETQDDLYEQFVRDTIQATPEKKVEERLKKLFGDKWKGSSGRQKVNRVADFFAQVLAGEKVGQASKTRQRALEEYKTVAPTLQRESAVMSAEDRARMSQETARERNEIARISAKALEFKNQSHSLYEQGALAIQQGNLQLAQEKFAEAKRVQEEHGPKLSNLFETSEYMRRLEATDPAKAKALRDSFIDLSGIQMITRGGGSQGGTTVTSGQQFLPPVQDRQGKWHFFKADRESTSVRTPSSGGNIAEKLQLLEQMKQLGPYQGGVGQQTPQAAPQQAPTLPMGPQQPMQAPGPQGVLQQMIRPPAPIGPQQSQAGPGPARGVREVMTLPEEFSRTTQETQGKNLAADREMRISGLARSLPGWYASGALDDFVGTPEGWAEGLRKKFGTSNEEIQTLDWVVTKGVPSEVNESSGLQFSIKEVEMAQRYWPNITDHPRSIMQRMNMINFSVQGNRYMRELGLTPRQRDLLAGEWFKEMAAQSKRITSMSETARGTTNWKNAVPTNVDMDPRIVVAKALRKARSANPSEFPLRNR